MTRFNNILFLFLLSLAACKTPTYIEKETIAGTSVDSPFVSEVVFNISENYQYQGVGCIAVPEFVLEHEDEDYSDIAQASAIRKAVYGVLSSKNYRGIELSRVDFKSNELGRPSEIVLLQSLDCDAVLKGRVLAFKNDYFVTYSVTTVELELTLFNRAGLQLWTARHAASSHEGAFPLSPLSLLSGMFTATTNKQDEVAYQMIDAVSRRLLSTLPDSFEQSYVEDITATWIDEKIAAEDLTGGSVETIDNQLSPLELLAKGAYEEALLAAEAEIKTNSSNGEAYLVAARASLLLSEYNAAIDYSLSALARGYKTAQAYSGLGIAYLKNEETRLAKAAFQKAAELEPSNFQVLYNSALISEVEGEVPIASNYYLKAGTLALDARELPRVHRAFSALKRLSSGNEIAQIRYRELGQKVQQLLNN